MSLEDKTCEKVPFVNFKVRENYKWVTKNSNDFFKHKRVILFALPGAFTPVCSTLHLPTYNELYDTFRSYGIDDVYCLAVNDGFVLEAWKSAEKASKITMIPDVDGEFSYKLGFLKNRNEMCLGNRSWRYSMVINDGIIEKMFIEPEGEGEDPYGISSAETMLKYLNPNAKFPDSVTIYTKHGCSICEEAKDILRKNSISFEELILNDQFSLKTLRAISGSTELPQIFINGKKVKNTHELNHLYGANLKKLENQ